MYNKNISVIVPIYNKEKYIENTIESLVNQNLKKIEIILVDDGSTDSSYERIVPFLKDKRIKYIKIQNSGVSIARNKGIELAQGKYIIFIDGDDFIDKSMLQNLYEKIELEKSDLIICGMREILNNKESIIKPLKNESLYLKKENLQKILSINPILLHSCGNKLFRLDIIKKNKLSFLEYCHNSEDLNFVLKYLNYVETIKIIKDIYYFYLRNEDSVTKLDTSNLKIKEIYLRELQKYYSYNNIKIFLENNPNKLVSAILDKKIKSYKLCKSSIKNLQNFYIKNGNISYSELRDYTLKIKKKYEGLDEVNYTKLKLRGYFFKIFRKSIINIYELKLKYSK